MHSAGGCLQFKGDSFISFVGLPDDEVEMVEGFKGEAAWLGEIFKQGFQEILYFFFIH